MNYAEQMREFADQYYEKCINDKEISVLISEINHEIDQKAMNGMYGVKKNVSKKVEHKLITDHFTNLGFKWSLNRGILKNSISIIWG